MTILLLLTAGAIVVLASCEGTDVEDVESSSDDDAVAGDKICGVYFGENIRPFFDSYCLRCHSIDRQGVERQDAPDDLNFDTQEDVLDAAESIRTVLLDNGTMPPDDPFPSAIERDDIITWLDCALDLS